MSSTIEDLDSAYKEYKESWKLYIDTKSLYDEASHKYHRIVLHLPESNPNPKPDKRVEDKNNMETPFIICTFESKYMASRSIIHEGSIRSAISYAKQHAKKFVPSYDHEAIWVAKSAFGTGKGLYGPVWPEKKKK